MNGQFYFSHDCSHTTAELLEAMYDADRDITLTTMRKHCPEMNDWALAHGYATHKRRGLRLCEDRYVSYHRSTFDGQPCYYMTWSAIDFIFLKKR